MDTRYVKRNPSQLNKAEAYFQHVFASEYSYDSIQFSTYMHMQYTVVKAILSILYHRRCLVYQIYQVQYPWSNKPRF